MREMDLEEFTSEKTFPFFIQFGKHNDDFYQHSHRNYIELTIVMNGSATHIVEHDSYPIQKGDVFVIGFNISHNFIDCHDLRVCNIMFHPYYLISLHADIKNTPGFHALFEIEPYLSQKYDLKSKLKISEKEYERLVPILDEMMNEYKIRLIGWKDVIKSYFLKLVVSLCRIYEQPPHASGNDLILMINAVTFMENHFAEPITMSDLARIACLSERHFTRLFLETYHITPFQYIMKFRLEHACFLLKHTTLSITEIASQCGFSDNNYFSRKFKTTYHCTPSEMRKHYNE